MKDHQNWLLLGYFNSWIDAKTSELVGALVTNLSSREFKVLDFRIYFTIQSVTHHKMERYKTLNVFDFTVKREKPKLGISIVGKRLCRDKTNAGIYVGTIHESGDIAKDGRIGKFNHSFNKT